MRLERIQQSRFKQKLNMKDFDSDNLLLSLDQFDVQSPQLRQSAPNADIQYLLTYISIKQDQQLNLTQNSLGQHNKLDTIPSVILSKYITKNSDIETAQTAQRETLVSIIDSGIHIISKIKTLMHKRKLDQQKNKSSLNPLDFFKELLFGKNSTTDSSREQKERKKPIDQQMKQLKIQSEIKILLATNQQSDEGVENGNNLIGKYRFVLTKSLQQRVEQVSKDQKTKLQINKKIVNLDEMLSKLEDFVLMNGNITQQQIQYEKYLTEIWIYLEGISGDFYDKTTQ